MSWTIIDVAIGQGTGGGGGGTPDNTTDTFIPVKQSGAFNNSAFSESGFAITSDKPIIAPSVTVDPGTVHVGAHALSSGGENFNFTNEADNDTFYPVWIKDGENLATARYTVGSEQELTQEASKADILINPSWQSDPVIDWRVVKLTFESDTTITNVIFKVEKNGFPFWQADVGTLTANIEKTVDLRAQVDTTFVDAFQGDTYIVSVSSVDGDVRLKGSIANSLPFFKVGYFAFEDKAVLIEGDLITRQIIRSGVKGDFSIASQSADTEVSVTADVGTSFTVHFNLDATVDNDNGFDILIPDAVIPVTNTVTAELYFVSVNSSGSFFTELTKTPSNSLTRVHLYEYAAINGVLFPETLCLNPYLSYTDKTLAGILESDGERVNGLDISSTDDVTLGIKTSDFDAIDQSINYASDKVNPHVRAIAGKDPLNWTYLLQTNTPPPPVGVDVLLDPTLYDNGGVATAVGANQATVQLVLLFGDDFGILRGQTLFNNYDDALLNINTTEFIIPTALFDAIEVGRVVLKGSATDSADVDEITIQSGIGGNAGGGSSSAGFVTRSLIAPSFDDARFFSELGLASGQNWNIVTSGSASITIVNDTVFGVPQDVHKLNDNTSGGIASATLPLVAQDWTNIFNWDASYSGTVKLDPVDGDEGCFLGLGCLAADSPDASPDKRRFGLNCKKSLTTNELRVFATDGNTLDVDVTGTQFDDYNEVTVKITRGSPPTAEVFVNGALQGTMDFLVHTGGTATDCSWSSGSTGGVDRVTYMSNYGVTIYKSDNVFTIGDAELNVDNADSVFPPGRRDYTISFSESITGSAVGNKFNVVALNNGGMLTVNNANPSNPKALFNGLKEITVGVNGVLNTSGVNGTDGGNSYDFQLAPLAVAGNGDVTLYNPAFRMLIGSTVDDGTGSKVQTTGGLSSDGIEIGSDTSNLIYEGVLLTDSELFTSRIGVSTRYYGPRKRVVTVANAQGSGDTGASKGSMEFTINSVAVTVDQAFGGAANLPVNVALLDSETFLNDGDTYDVSFTQGTNADAVNLIVYLELK